MTKIERARLISGQLGVWYAQLLTPENSIFNAGEYLELHGELDVALFENALQLAVYEADALHLRFSGSAAEPRQTVDKGTPWELQFLDVSVDPDPPAVAHRWMLANMRRAVNLRHGPLFTQALFKLAPDRFYWYQRVHHIAIDGYSAQLIVSRTAEIYSSLLRNVSFPTAQFGSLSILLENDSDYQKSVQFREDRKFWLDQLADLGESRSTRKRGVEIPPRPFIRTMKNLNVGYSAAMRRAALRLGTSITGLVCSVAATYLHRLLGIADVVIGLLVDGRVGSAQLTIPGMMANTVAIRVQVTSKMTVETLARELHRIIRQALRHRRYRYEYVRRDLNSLDQNSLLQLTVNIMSFSYTADFGNCRAVARNIGGNVVYDQAVSIYNRSSDGSMELAFDANPEIYDRTENSRNAKLFQNILDAFIDADTTTRLGNLATIDKREQDQVLFEWNSVGRAAGVGVLPQLFESQAGEFPDGVAVSFGSVALRYDELNRRANRLARWLIGCGVGPESLVAVMMARSADVVVVLLAILKAGGAYVPVDPAYPDDRVRFILEDTRPILAVVDNVTARRSCFAGSLRRFVVDEDNSRRSVARYSAVNVTDAERISPLTHTHPAYVIYTSGSTGQPKGVCITHANVMHLLAATRDLFHFTRHDVWTWFHSFAFDFSVWELWGALAHGGRLVVVPFEVARSPNEFLDLLVRERVTILNQTPSAFYPLIEAATRSLARAERLALRTVIFGGEALQPGRLRRWYDHHPDNAPLLVNMYGITETTVHASYTALTTANTEVPASVIGRGLPGSSLYVLDSSLQPVPVGTTGELYIGGEQLARGYLNRPELTAERFVANPFSHHGERMYRTGDLVRWQVGGQLEYQGRVDEQVKVRGYRIELGEIESILSIHDFVAQAAVIVREDQPGDKKITAYLTPTTNLEYNTVELLGSVRRFLLDKVPDYMVPASMVVISELPLTPNGKLDRRALPPPDYTESPSNGEPTTRQQKLLCRLFEEALNIPSIGINDSFFERGGNSISAVALVNRLHTHGISVDVRTIFSFPTVSTLSAQLPGPKASPPVLSSLDMVLPIRTEGRHSAIFCIHPVLGLSWCYTDLANHVPRDRPVYGLQAPGLDGKRPFARSIPDLATQYIEHIRELQPTGPYFLLGWSLGGNIAQEIAVQLREMGEPIELLAALDAYPPQLSGDRKVYEARITEELAAVATMVHSDQALRGLPARLIDRFVAISQNNLRLHYQHTPRALDGDIVLLAAGEHLPGEPRRSPDRWNQFISGRITQVDLPCNHWEMLREDITPRIWRVISEFIDPTGG